MAALFRFRSILISLNTVHRFKVHRNRFRFNGMEWNRNVTVFMPPTVYLATETYRLQLGSHSTLTHRVNAYKHFHSVSILPGEQQHYVGKFQWVPCINLKFLLAAA